MICWAFGFCKTFHASVRSPIQISSVAFRIKDIRKSTLKYLPHPGRLVLKKIIAVFALVAVVIAAVLLLGVSGDPFVDKGDGSRFAIFAIMKDGSEVPLTGGFAIQPNSIQFQGQVIVALKVVIQVRGASPDYDQYRLLTSSQLQFRIGEVTTGAPTWFSTNVLTAANIFAGSTRTLPFDNVWRNVPDRAFSSPDGWQVDSNFNLIVPASFIQETALAAGMVAPATLIFTAMYILHWDVPEDPTFSARVLQGSGSVGLTMAGGTAGLEGDVTVGPIVEEPIVLPPDPIIVDPCPTLALVCV